ncbi:hypothetical protein Cni_G00997 [Canna indica]|uniref:DUF7866 domain-containing protein n=1 Tax=Canna indica TaxID=4628 RepID=A0AAQ3JNT5_9LILI|nr:hypothetical protein Cni_G00997 [Canna indica]
MSNLRVILVLMTSTILLLKGGKAVSDNNIEYIPATTNPVYRPVTDAVISSAPFKQCATWRCCAGGDPKNCKDMQACHQLVCNLPNKPFGTCALKPISCDCKNCS